MDYSKDSGIMFPKLTKAKKKKKWGSNCLSLASMLST